MNRPILAGHPWRCVALGILMWSALWAAACGPHDDRPTTPTITPRATITQPANH